MSTMELTTENPGIADVFVKLEREDAKDKVKKKENARLAQSEYRANNKGKGRLRHARYTANNRRRERNEENIREIKRVWYEKDKEKI